MPWCPKCKTEYREGFRVCADCGSVLVDELTEESEFEETLDLRAKDFFDGESPENQEETISAGDEGEILAAAGKVLSGGVQAGFTRTAPSGPATIVRRLGCCWGLARQD